MRHRRRNRSFKINRANKRYHSHHFQNSFIYRKLIYPTTKTSKSKPKQSQRKLTVTKKVKEQPKSQVKGEKYNTISEKIEDIKDRINQEFQARKDYIKESISEDSQCFIKNENQLLQLKQEFIEYLLEESNHGFLEKRKLKKKLEKIRLNLEEGKEDILIHNEGFPLFGSDKNESLIEKHSSEWRIWKELINFIGNHIKKYKISLKREKLNNIYSEYEKIKFTKPKKKPESNVIICEKCGSENSLKAVYCHYCGNELKAEKKGNNIN
ncbi:MAG: zinc ribbon domain-containing protein [Promethearchaeia archaeon]